VLESTSEHHDEGDGLDGLRAICVAHWDRHADAGAPARVIASGERAAAVLERWGLTIRGTTP
jgi:hypothetical protein